MKVMGCADATSTIKITLQNLKATDQDTYIVFINTVKAFDSVHREMLWKILEKHGIPEKTILVIKKCTLTQQQSLASKKKEFSSYPPLESSEETISHLFSSYLQFRQQQIQCTTTGKHKIYLKKNCSTFLKATSTKVVKNGTSLNHKDTFYVNDVTFIFLTKENLINEKTFVQKSFADFGLEVHL